MGIDVVPVSSGYISLEFDGWVEYCREYQLGMPLALRWHEFPE
jgi:hypothetical protein